MKKLILPLLLVLVTVITVTAQQWTVTPETPFPYNVTLLNSVRSHAALGENLYVVTGTNSKTVVLVYNTTTATLDTMPGGDSLPITGASCKLGPDSTLWVVGIGINSDSVIWWSSLASVNPTPFQNLWGPRFRPGTPAKFAWVKSVEFLGDDVYFAGRWDSVGAQRAPNLIRWSKSTEQFTVPPQTALVTVAANPNNSAIAAKFAKLSAPGTIMVTLPFRNDSILVITGQNTGYVQKLTAPPLAGYTTFTPYDPISYKNDLYFFASDLDPNTLDGVWLRMLRRNHASGTVETVAQLDNGPWGSEFIPDVDTIAGKLVLLMEYGFSKDSLSQQRFYPVMAYDSVSFSPVIDSVSDGAIYQTAFKTIANQYVFGRGVARANGIVGAGFYKLNYSDTTPPVITLIGNDTITLEKGDPYTELGATAYDAEDGDITNVIVSTGMVDTGVVGVYTITYTVSDAAGNTVSVTRTVIVQSPNAISEAHYLNQLIVFPDKLLVTPEMPLTVQLLNTVGQTVMSTTCIANTYIPLGQYPTGVYLVVLNQKAAKKIVIH